MTTVAKLKGNEAVEVVTAGLPNKEQNVPCDQCTDPARCENFGVCQIFKHTLPSGSYEQRIKEHLTDDDVFTLVGHATILRGNGEHDMPAYFFGLALRIADHLGDPELVRRMEELAAQQMDPAGADAPCKPGTRCSRSIRGLGGCEAGSCEREEGAGGVNLPDGAKNG